MIWSFSVFIVICSFNCSVWYSSAVLWMSPALMFWFIEWVIMAMWSTFCAVFGLSAEYMYIPVRWFFSVGCEYIGEWLVLLIAVKFYVVLLIFISCFLVLLKTGFQLDGKRWVSSWECWLLGRFYIFMASLIIFLAVFSIVAVTLVLSKSMVCNVAFTSCARDDVRSPLYCVLIGFFLLQWFFQLV